MKNILILGGNGMLGRMVAKYFIDKKYFVDVCLSKQYELPYKPRNIFLQNFLLPHNLNFKSYDYVINCIGAIKQKQHSTQDLYYLNAVLPNNLALQCKLAGCKMIHYSSDCVFSGNTDKAYNKFDECDALDDYGRSKFLGESPNAIVIRSSIIGPASDTFGLFEWFRSQTAPVNGFINHYWSGLTTLEMAKQTENLISSDVCNGLYQLSSCYVDKCSLLNKINSIFSLNKQITPHKTSIINRCLISDYPIRGIEEQLLELKEYCNE